MKDLIQVLNKPFVVALFILLGSIYILNSISTEFVSNAKKDREEMVKSLRQAQTPEPQVVAISAGFDRLTSEVDSMAVSFFGFFSMVMVLVVGTRQRDLSPRNSEPQTRGELKREGAV
jgi:hypothetical protein